MSRPRRFWITLALWLAIGLPLLIAVAAFRSDKLPLPQLPPIQDGFRAVFEWGAVVLWVYLTPIFLVAEEWEFRRVRKSTQKSSHAED